MKDKFFIIFKYVSEYSLYGLLFFLAISNAAVEIFAVLILVGFIGRKVIKPDFSYLKFWPNIFLLFFILFNAFSLFNSGEFLNKSLHALFGKWMQYLGIYIIIQESVYDRKIIKRGMSVFLFGASLAILSGLSQYFFGFEFLRHNTIGDMGGGVHPIMSSFVHHNAFGGYLVVVLSFVVALLLSGNSFGLKGICLLIFSVFSIITVILTFSRGSWLAIVASLVFLFIYARQHFKRLIPVFLVIIAMFLFSSFHERLFLIFKAGGDSDRFRYWLASWKMIKEHPLLGIGTGTYMANFSKYLPGCNVSYAHNCYLQIWAETGIFSLISFVLFVSSFIYVGVKKFLALNDFMLLGLLSGVIGFLVHSFFDTNLYSLRLAVLFWVWLGLLSALIKQNNNQHAYANGNNYKIEKEN